MTILVDNYPVLPRHQPYVCALETVNSIDYFNLVSQFLLDAAMSANNADDQDTFMDLMSNTIFASRTGSAIFSSYFKFLSSDEEQLKTLAARFFVFLEASYGDWFAIDQIDNLILDYPPILVEQVFYVLSDKHKIDFLNELKRYPNKFASFPRLKLYRVFM
jgi:hypothetical protein